LIVVSKESAFADANDPVVEKVCLRYGCKVQAKKRGSDVPDSRTRPGKGRIGKDARMDADAAEDRQEDEWRKDLAEFERRYAAFERQNAIYTQCIRKGTTTCPNRPVPPDPLSRGSARLIGGGPPVVLFTPAQAGAIAAARLQLPTVAPGIGPPPDLNRWKMAAVGYPLWLWADGPTHVGPVSDSVAGLSVSLEASVTSLTFRMGDGNTVQCPGAGDKWSKAVEPGSKAPRCGHTYTEPSLPRGNYTVSALTDWAVTWTANGQSGVINVPAVQTTQLPVGELQVLVR
jgi:hypothetical protein